MQRKTGCWLVAGVLLVLLAILAAAGWLWYRARSAPDASGPVSSVLVELSLPSNGDEVNLGDQVAVAARAFSASPIEAIELYVDGRSLGAVRSPAPTAYWTWQALPSGIHTFYAVASDGSGAAGHSQTLIINVLQGKGWVQVPAEEGQTMEQIGAGFGATADQMSASNPKLEPTQPLHDGQLVDVPIPPGPPDGQPAPNGGDVPPAAGDGLAGPVLISIVWNIKFTEPADQTYCYESNGNGEWDKMPKDAFTFFEGVDGLYTQLLPVAGQHDLQVQCWGWLGGALKYLGEGKTSFDAAHMPEQLVISGAGFQFVGKPSIPVAPQETVGGAAPNFPPPYAAREPSNASDCTAHSHPLLAEFICKTLLDAKVKQYTLVEWEWKAPTCWPGYCSNVVQAVDGYRIYELNPISKESKIIRQIDNASQKITAIALPWGTSVCYSVSAFTNSPPLESGSATYCPGNPPEAQKATFKPVNWVTTGGEWMDSGDCSDYGGGDNYLVENKNSGFGNNGEVLVGSYIVDDGDCFRQGDYAGGVRFAPTLPPGGVVKKAVLRLSVLFMDFGSTGWGSPAPASCLSGINKSSVDWTAYSSGNHYTASPALYGSKFGSPITSVSQWSNQEVDVTSAVTSWLAYPSNNHGFNLLPAAALDPQEDGHGECLSGLGNFELDVEYFMP